MSQATGKRFEARHPGNKPRHLHLAAFVMRGASGAFRTSLSTRSVHLPPVHHSPPTHTHTYSSDPPSFRYTYVKRISHSVVFFHMPRGVGKNLDLQLVVGTVKTPVVSYSYSAPVVASRTPNAAVSPTDFNANGDVLTIYGYNFGYDGYSPSDDYVKVKGGGGGGESAAAQVTSGQRAQPLNGTCPPSPAV